MVGLKDVNKMSDFKTYYNNKFSEDLNRFFSVIPNESKFHDDMHVQQIFSIQYERLTPQRNHLDFLNKEMKEYFGVALFFTVLIDMVCYSYFQNHYSKFQSLTRYPKFIGNCLSWCRFHLYPNDIFRSMNQGQNSTEPYLFFHDKFIEAVVTMEKETISFFNQYLTEINGAAFWELCKTEFPYRSEIFDD